MTPELPASGLQASDAGGWDLLVVGAGMAGLVAANRARDAGLSVCVIEKGSAEVYPCNTRISGGALHICMRDMLSDRDTLLEAVERTTDGHALPELARALVDNAPRTYRWLRQVGVPFVQVAAIGQHYVLAPPRPNRAGPNWQGRGGDVTVRLLGERLRRLGGRLVRGARAASLRIRDGACVGIDVEHGAARVAIAARTVLLADGGYQADPELLARHVTPRPQALVQRNAGTGTGDGIRMAVAAGARLVGMDSGFYGHTLCQGALRDPGLWPFPLLDFVASAGIVVGPDGRRFTDEGLGGVHLTNAIARLPDPLSAVVIFDEPIWQGPGRYRAIPPNPHLVLANAEAFVATALPALAAEVGLPPPLLAWTVGDYNAAVRARRTGRLSPPRSAAPYAPMTIEQPPFYAVRMAAGITYTMGGIRIDEHARVIGADGDPIPNLYAAGSTTGGLDGGPGSGYVGGLCKAAVFGLLAAEHAAQHVRSASQPIAIGAA